MHTPSKAAKPSIASLYLLKALCAFGVVCLHAPVGFLSEGLVVLFQFTVPIFLMVTGYFLYTEDKEKLLAKLGGSIKKVFIIVLITHLVYTLLYLEGIPPLTDYVLWAKWVILGQHYAGGHLWYLSSLLEALIVFWIITKLGGKKYIGYGSLLIVCYLSFGMLRPLIFGSPESMMVCNVVCYGIPFVAIGFLFRQYEKTLINLAPMLWIVLGFSTLALANKLFVTDGSAIQMLVAAFARLGLITSLFILALQSKDYGAGSYAEALGKDLSGNIYYWHGAVISLMTYLLAGTALEEWVALPVFIITTVLAYAIAKGQKALGVTLLP